ncbi:type IV pilus modification protein PilV [Psychrobacter sp. DAB_AL62B]|uniref:type IV pilus modification protein PilV n=1 Tax=Psychrobacter sp. DAB_AL62B TaxID=1028420 RepID=UPI002380E69D|nr:type IV pilus modification protein PilV [Psychrobacter sp. DAB_AL62B]MDE4454485.1 type IV pilus modification protein PilV [Psychrobacter sp. DAB_AL62B]
MKNEMHQQGVGLVEVLVAVLLLSVAVLGFSALQVKAISATDESLVRTKSLTIIRNLAEVMRAYPEAYVTGSGTAFTAASSSDATAVPTIQAVISSSATDTVTVSSKKIKDDGTVVTDTKVISVLATGDNCLSTGFKTVKGKKVPEQSCSMHQLAARDALMIKKMVADEEINLAITTCPGTTVQSIQQQMCIITAWNDTKALLDDTDKQACANTNGIYKTGNHCIISEAY